MLRRRQWRSCPVAQNYDCRVSSLTTLYATRAPQWLLFWDSPDSPLPGTTNSNAIVSAILRDAAHILKVQPDKKIGSLSVSDERAASAVDRKLGERVRARRLEVGLSQEQLAELLGITFQQVQKYEKGVNRIAASRLHDISVALDVSVARFFDGLSGVHRGAKAVVRPEDLFAHPGAADLVRLYVSIDSAKVRRRVLDLVRAMADEKA